MFDGRLCSGSVDYTIRLWNIDDGVCEQILTGHTSRLISVLPDGNTVGVEGVDVGAVEGAAVLPAQMISNPFIHYR